MTIAIQPVKENKQPSRIQQLGMMLKADNVKKRFNDVLGKRAAGFVSSILSVSSQNKMLCDADPTSIISAAAIAASLDLPINPNLGFAYIVPYREKGVSRAQFQMGYKGFIQLAMRSGQYKTINADKIYEGMIKKRDILRGTIEFEEDDSLWDTEKVVGYFAYFETMNGMQKMVEMSSAQVEQHAKKYSKAYAKGFGPWKDNFEVMALKTVLKKLLSKWGILSIDMQIHTAVQADQATDGNVIDGEWSYDDKPEEEETKEEKPTKNKKSRAKQAVESVLPTLKEEEKLPFEREEKVETGQ